MRVTVGVPVWRSAATLGASLDSILNQTIKDLTIIVSDNCSPDATWEICRAYAAQDKRVKIFRQEQNIYYMNFGFVLDKASSPYFVWLAGDDVWAPTYLERCVEVLEQRLDAVLCVAHCQFLESGRPVSISAGTAPLTGDWEQNVHDFLRQTPNDNSRMYGVFRTEALKQSFPYTIMHAYDWALSAASLKYGKHLELPDILMFRDLTPSASYVRLMHHDNRGALFRIFPVLRMTLYLLHKRRIPLTPRIIGALAAMNLRMHGIYVSSMHPTYYRFTKPFYEVLRRYILWRF